MEDTNKTNTESTSIEQVEINLDELLGTPGAENVMLPEGSDKKTETKQNIFSQPTVDLSFIDNDSDDESPEKVTIDDIIKDADPEDDFSNPSAKDEPKSTGRPKLEKSGMVELVNKLIEKGQIIPFDDDKPDDRKTVLEEVSLDLRTPELGKVASKKFLKFQDNYYKDNHFYKSCNSKRLNHYEKRLIEETGQREESKVPTTKNSQGNVKKDKKMLPVVPEDFVEEDPVWEIRRITKARELPDKSWEYYVRWTNDY